MLMESIRVKSDGNWPKMIDTNSGNVFISKNACVERHFVKYYMALTKYDAFVKAQRGDMAERKSYDLSACVIVKSKTDGKYYLRDMLSGERTLYEIKDVVFIPVQAMPMYGLKSLIPGDNDWQLSIGKGQLETTLKNLTVADLGVSIVELTEHQAKRLAFGSKPYDNQTGKLAFDNYPQNKLVCEEIKFCVDKLNKAVIDSVSV